MIPDKFKGMKTGVVHEKGRLLVNDEYLTPLQILENDPFFAEYRVEDKMIELVPREQKIVENYDGRNNGIIGGNYADPTILNIMSSRDIDIDKILGGNKQKIKKVSKRSNSNSKKKKNSKRSK
jgi:hypothetical protein